MAPKANTYKIECWGASGGFLYQPISFGGYVSGNIALGSTKILYLYLGFSGKKTNEVYINQYVFNYGWENYQCDGGGSSDVRLVYGDWDNTSSLTSRIMVAGGGGASGGLNGSDSGNPTGGAAGGLTGYQGGTCISHKIESHPGSHGGGQTSGFAFGIAQNKNEIHSPSYVIVGGGNGYWSGSKVINDHKTPETTYSGVAGSGGGSSFISGHNGCLAIKSATDLSSSGQSVHYSGYKFTDTVMIDGQGYLWTTSRQSKVGMPSPTGGTEYGHNGSGVCHITFAF